jgi:hypothetical protein
VSKVRGSLLKVDSPPGKKKEERGNKKKKLGGKWEVKR